jgi:serine/threonine protein phosphatase PrpC
MSSECSKYFDVGGYSQIGIIHEELGDPNQDNFLIKKIQEDILLVGVFDGHGIYGKDISIIVKNAFEEIITQLFKEKILNEYEIKNHFINQHRENIEIIEKSFKKIDSLLRMNEYYLIAEQSGTTATIILIDKKKKILTLGYVGDSEVVMGLYDQKNLNITQKGKIIIEKLGEPHRINHYESIEKSRIINHGACIIMENGNYNKHYVVHSEDITKMIQVFLFI